MSSVEYEKVKDKIYVKRGQSVGMTDENFVVALSDEDVYELSPAAYYIWELMEGDKTVEQVVARIVEELEMSPEELKEPVAAMVEKLAEVGLLEELEG
ncbi:MAG: PqqD family protein [Fervidicoccaceae archaeon]